MDVKNRNEWIDIAHLESQRTYFMCGKQPVVIDEPSQLMIYDDGSHLVVDKIGRGVLVSNNWYAFKSRGKWGIQVASHVGDEVVPEFQDVDPEAAAIDFIFPKDLSIRVRGASRMMQKASGSVKVETNGEEIFYISKAWIGQRIIWKEGSTRLTMRSEIQNVDRFFNFLKDMQCQGTSDIYIERGSNVKTRKKGAEPMDHHDHALATVGLLDPFMVKQAGEEEFERFMSDEPGSPDVLQFTFSLDGKNHRGCAIRVYGPFKNYHLAIRLL